MKKLTYILLTLLVLAACTSRQEYAAMRQELDSINERNRNDEPFTVSDVQPYLEFFDRHGKPNDQMLAHYLLGRAYHEQGEAPMALQCYQQAIECADTLSEDCDFAQLSRVYAQMGEVFYEQSLYNQYFRYLDLSINSFYKSKDTINAFITYEQKSFAYRELNQLDSAVTVSEEVASLYRNFGYESYAATALGSIARALLIQGRTDKAKKYMIIYEAESGLFYETGEIEEGREAYYNTKGLLSLKENKLDSAEYWYRKELSDGKDFNNQNGGALGLAMVYEQRHIPDSAAKYYQYAYAMNDSMYTQMTTSEVERMQAMYDYSSHQEAARKAELKAERTRTLLFVLLAAGVIVIAVGTLLYLQYRNRKRAEIQQLTNDYGRALMEYNKQNAELECLKQEDSSLIEEKQQEVEELKEKLQKYQSALQTSNANRQVSDFTDSDIVTVFREKAKGGPKVTLPTEEEWKRLVSQFSQSVPLAFSAMGRNVVLSANEMRVCVLLLSGFKIADIAILLDCSPQSITNIKARANNKIFAENSAATLEKNLMKTVGLPQT